MVNLGNVLPDEAFTVSKQVIPHSWKQGPSFVILLKLGNSHIGTIPLAHLFMLTLCG